MCPGQFCLCRLQLQPLNISWTTVTEPALAASPAVDQLQTRQTLLSGCFFPTARLPRWFDQPIQSVLLAAIINTEVSVTSAAQLRNLARTSVLWDDINWLIDWLIYLHLYKRWQLIRTLALQTQHSPYVRTSVMSRYRLGTIRLNIL